MKNKDNLSLTLLASTVLLCSLIIGSSAAQTSGEENASDNGPSANNEFPYPRGTAPPYGMMGWETGTQFLTDNATLVHLGWSTSITPQQFVDNIHRGKELGIPKYLVATSGPQMTSESFWKSVKDMGVTDDDFYGVYFPDEEGNPATLITMNTAMKKYFPNAVAGDYLGDMQTGPEDDEFIPGLDVSYFTTYTKFHPERPHAWVYGNLIANAPDWKNKGKTVYVTTEAFGQAAEVNALDPDLNTTQKVADRHESQIVMGILGGAQGVFSYAYKYAEDTPSYTGWASFKPKYEQVWPWIMEGNRTLLETNVTSGRTGITSDPGGRIDAVTAYMFTDTDGRKLVASSSMLDFTEANGMANNATITGVPDGTYDVLWENRTVNVADGTITDTWQPYEYHFYQLKTEDTNNTNNTDNING
ncbi:hypothetical protein [Methanosarcina acetivorans]|uniref:Uncharacterized protein n=1 Tax=Methanosarcina acetivorans (strain ATCC 35395 / DSM 2834 / JCM 12185 / C2A) TaxID=188937 RepID=Q8TMD3_METAC|nr:hypothetical protein [Methanosarcina acetivorans]AAM06105.1 predicted protein [Methanosarcina acetivorans C2A]